MFSEISYFVFCDVDETLLTFKSMIHFLNFLKEYKNVDNKISKKAHTFLKRMCYLKSVGMPRELLNWYYYWFFKKISVATIQTLSIEWFNSLDQKKIICSRVLKEIIKHKKKGAKIVLVSGSFLFCLKPIISLIGAYDCLCTNQMIDAKNRFTGKIQSPQVIGHGKAKAIQIFMKNHTNIKLQDCYAYGDDISDIPMLESVGHPVAMAGILSKYAEDQGWQII